MIIPSIGRVVWIHSRHGAAKSSQPEAALICFVHGDRLINVGGFSAHGMPFANTSVALLQDDDSPPAGGVYATWMPYQVKVAATADAPGVMHASNFDLALDDWIRSLEREMHVLMGRSPADAAPTSDVSPLSSAATPSAT